MDKTTASLTTPLPGGQDLPDVSREIKEAYAKKIKQYPVYTNYASRLGHPCTRQAVYWRNNWQEATPINVITKFLFEAGNVIETYIAKPYLEAAGYQIVEQNRPINVEKSGIMNKYQIGGRLDFIARKNRFEFPVEVKSMAPHAWQKINTIEDMHRSAKHWHQSYPAQLTLYLLGKEYEFGMFLLINKITFEPKQIWVNLDFTYAEDLLKKAETINEHVKAKTLPDRIPWSESICARCPFVATCLPDVESKGMQIVDSAELESKIDRLEEIRPMSIEFKELKEDVDETVKEVGENMLVGKYSILLKTSKTTRYDVPMEIKKDYVVKGIMQRVSIIRNQPKPEEKNR